MKATLLFMSLLSAGFIQAQNSNTHFSHTETTIASPEKIWKLWTDVELWPRWDSGLKKATLEGSFISGAKGKLIPDKGPKTSFKITDLSEKISYTIECKIPFGKLIITRRLKQENMLTSFTHEIRFTGLLKNNMGGKRYRKMLPEVMKELKRLVETENL